MSLETELQALTAAVLLLRDAMTHSAAAPAAAPSVAPAPLAPPATTLPAPPFPSAASAAPVFAAVAPVAAPSFAPAPVAAATAAPRPFNDVAGCVQYVVERFKALGPRGALIQGILSEMNITNISNVTPEQFDTLYARVSAL